jgi:hypothetical protein
MAEHEYLSFTDSLGRNPVQRVAAFGYTPTDTWGSWPTEELQEINFAGSDTPETAFEAWHSSPNSRRIMLSDRFVVAGVGKAHNPQWLYGWCWTVDFGSYDDPQAISLTPSPRGIPSSSHLTPTIAPSPTPTISPTRTLSPTLRERDRVAAVVPGAVRTMTSAPPSANAKEVVVGGGR